MTPEHRPRPTSDLRSALVAAARDDPNWTRVARRFGVSPGSVERYAVRVGLVRQGRGEDRKHPVNTAAFDVPTPETAYWVGMLMADGNVHKSQVRLCLDHKDADHLHLFLGFVGAHGTPLYRHGETGLNATVSSAALAERLGRYGIVPGKTYTDPLASADVATQWAFWLGMLDGDGTVGWHRSSAAARPAPYLMWCGSRRLMEQAADQLASTGARPKARPYRSIFTAAVHGVRAQRVIGLMYHASPVALARKRRKAEEALLWSPSARGRRDLTLRPPS